MDKLTIHLDNNQLAFFALLRAGLFPVHGEGNSELRIDGTTDWNYVYRLSQEQSVQGLVLQGIEELRAKNLELRVPQVLLLQWIGEVQIIEQRNKEMNAYIAEIIEKLRKNDIYTLLVKGQGVAQCYDKPFWRVSGDIDLYLSRDNYEKAKSFLKTLAQHVDAEDKSRLHLGMTVDGWVVELHGTMHTKLSRRMNRGADEVHNDLFCNGNVRSWNDNGVPVFLPSANNDVIIIFNHIINHFFLEGVGLRQICDWCRLLYTYRDSLDYGLLESRLCKMELMTEWKVFGTLAVEYLGMPQEFMPFYSDSKSYQRKADRVLAIILETGNFGHNKDLSYRTKNSTVVVNIITLWRRICDFTKFMRVFPVDSPKFFCHYLLNRITKN